MAPFDGPALAAAKLRIATDQPKGGVNGRKLKINTCDTQNNNRPGEVLRAHLFGQAREIMFTTCDVDFATPVVQEAINRGVLAISPCIGTDQMGPKRFGGRGRLAFSFGNVAQDEGSAMAESAYRRRLAQRSHRDPTTSSCTSRTSPQAFEAPLHRARRQDRGAGELHDRLTTSRRPSAG